MAILFDVVDSEKAQKISDNLVKNWTPIGPNSPELPDNVVSFITSFEIQSHFLVQKPDRALDLIRRSWGWYINNKNGTESTVIEGYLVNGTFAYRSSRGYYYDTSYVSHAHGWSSGPTSSLTNYIVGLSVTSQLGLTWSLAPQFGDLEYAQAGFVTSLGKYQASWTKEKNSYSIELKVPAGTSGEITLPYVTSSKKPTITVDGSVMKRGVTYANDLASFSLVGTGSHKIVVK